MSEAAAPATVPRPNLSSPHRHAAVLPLVLRTGLPALRAAVRGRRAAGDRAPSFCRIFDLHVGLLHLIANRLLALRGLLAHADLLGNPGSLLDDRFLGHFAYFDGLFLESFVAGADRAVYGPALDLHMLFAQADFFLDGGLDDARIDLHGASSDLALADGQLFFADRNHLLLAGAYLPAPPTLLPLGRTMLDVDGAMLAHDLRGAGRRIVTCRAYGHERPASTNALGVVVRLFLGPPEVGQSADHAPRRRADSGSRQCRGDGTG